MNKSQKSFRRETQESGVICITQVSDNEYNIILSAPYKILWNKEDDYYVVEDKEINIFALEKTLELLTASIEEYLIVLYRSYCLCSLSELDRNASILRGRLRKYFNESY